MGQATCLRDLLRIRKEHALKLRSIPGCLGTAVGFRYDEKTGKFEGEGTPEGRKPAVLVFVDEKIPLSSLSVDLRVDRTLKGPGDLWCHTDVIIGKPPEEINVAPPTTGDNASLLHALHHSDVGVIGGLPIEGPSYTGTAGVMIELPGGKRGALTNYHVAEDKGARIDRGGGVYEVLGKTKLSIYLAPKTPEYPNDLESFTTNAGHRVDIGLIELEEATAIKAKPGVYGLRQPLGPVYKLHLDDKTFDPIGRKVVGVGQALGRQPGRILAYGYEWGDSFEGGEWFATDYLIKGEGTLPFAAPGDSGKLVVTDDDVRNPIALLWGGEQRFDSNIPAQQALAYATELGLVLKLLGNVTLLK